MTTDASLHTFFLSCLQWAKGNGYEKGARRSIKAFYLLFFLYFFLSSRYHGEYTSFLGTIGKANEYARLTANLHPVAVQLIFFSTLEKGLEIKKEKFFKLIGFFFPVLSQCVCSTA